MPEQTIDGQSTADVGPGGSAPYDSFGDAVQDLTELAAIAPGERDDKQARLVEDEQALYFFDAEGTVGGVVPDTGTGRWYKIGSGVAAVTSVFTRSGAVAAQSGDYNAAQVTNAFDKMADDTDVITEGITKKFASAAQLGKVDQLTVTQPVDLDTMETDVVTNNVKVTNATHTGDVTGSGALTIADDVVSNTKLANMAANTVKLNNTAFLGGPVDLTMAASTMLARLASGDIVAATVAQIKNLLGIPANKEVWFPTVRQQAVKGSYTVMNIGTNGGGRVTFHVPADFTNLVSLKLVGIVSVNAAQTGRNIDFFSDYAPIGGVYNGHEESDTTTIYDLSTSSDELYAFDVSGVFTALAAGDFCGLFIDHNGVGGNIGYVGIVLKYT